MLTKGMSPEEVAAWMRREHEALLELSKVLQQHVAGASEMSPADWLHGLRAGFERLRAHLERHFAVQETDGYLNVVIEQRPTLSRQVEQIRREHGEILKMAARILRDLSDTHSEEELLTADLGARVQRFIAVVKQHEQSENFITLLVFNQDLGGMD